MREYEVPNLIDWAWSHTINIYGTSGGLEKKIVLEYGRYVVEEQGKSQRSSFHLCIIRLYVNLYLSRL